MATKDTPDNKSVDGLDTFSNRIPKGLQIAVGRSDSYTAQPVPTDLDVGDVLDVVKNDRRRLALQKLAREPMAKTHLAEFLAAELEGEAASAARKRAYVSLHQTHLPTLAELDIVEERDGVWALGPEAEVALEVATAVNTIVGGDGE